MNTKHFIRMTGAALLAAWINACSWLATPLVAEPPEPQLIDGKIDWVYNYENGKRLSKESGRPMFIVFRCER